MDETQSGGVQMDAWVASRLGFALDSFIDREVNRAQQVYDPSRAFGMGEDGRIYPLGQPAGRVTTAIGGGVGGVNSTLLLVGIVLLVVLASKG